MKRFVLHITAVLIGVLIFNFTYVVLVGGNLRNYARKYLDFDRQAGYVVLGDSHANRAWSSNRDVPAYNFAYGSDNIHDLLLKAQFVSKHHDCDSITLILSFEPHLISIYRESKNNNRINALLNSGMPNVSTLVWFPLVFDPNTEIDTKIFVRRLIGRKKTRLVASPSSFSNSRAEERFSEQFGEGQVSMNLIREYQELIDLAHEKGWRIFALKYPVHPYFDSLIEHRPAARKLLVSMDSLAAVNKLRVEDYSNEINRPEWFADQDHLNDTGSNEFLKVVIQQLNADDSTSK